MLERDKLGGTFGGNPLACESALAALEIVERENLCRRARDSGEHFERTARGWQRSFPQIRAIHGLGAMRSIELWRPESRQPADVETRDLVKYCYEHGLLMISAGTYGNVLRLLLPLIVTDQQFEEGLSVIQSALGHVFQHAAATLKVSHA